MLKFVSSGVGGELAVNPMYGRRRVNSLIAVNVNIGAHTV